MLILGLKGLKEVQVKSPDQHDEIHRDLKS